MIGTVLFGLRVARALAHRSGHDIDVLNDINHAARPARARMMQERAQQLGEQAGNAPTDVGEPDGDGIGGTPGTLWDWVQDLFS